MPRAGWKSVQALDRRAVDDKLTVPERRTAETRQDAVLDIGEDLELFPKLSAVPLGDRFLRPLEQVAVPQRTVVRCNRRNASEDVVGTMAIGQRGVQSLPHRIRATAVRRPVDRDEQTFHSARESVVTTGCDGR